MDVEREYRARVDAMSVVERVGRADALFKWSRDYLVRSILEARGPLSRRELARELALRQYGSDPAARQWLEELRTHAAR
jgi:hypothetical protein